MRRNFGAQTWMYPMPVLILAAYGEDGIPMAMNAAWGGISESNQISVTISASHKTTANIRHSGAFTVSMADAAHVAACDYVGIETGNKVPDKLEKAGFHTRKSGSVNAPVIDELPMTLECELVSYDPETERLTGKIVNVSADESILGADGKIDPALLDPISFDPVSLTYRRMGEVVGRAFRDGNALKQR